MNSSTHQMALINRIGSVVNLNFSVGAYVVYEIYLIFTHIDTELLSSLRDKVLIHFVAHSHNAI